MLTEPIYQIAIATGAIIGGLLVDSLGARGAIGYCGLGAAGGSLVMFGLGRSSAIRSEGVTD